MTDKTDFTDEEWKRLGRAPIIAGMAISLADPGGPIEAFKETHASLKAVLDAAEEGASGPFVQAVAQDVASVRARQNPAAGFKPRGALAGQQILDELAAVNEIVSRKAAPEDADAFRAWLLDAARRTAEAAKEGGFMGFRAELVSEGERQMLDKLAEVLGAVVSLARAGAGQRIVVVALVAALALCAGACGDDRRRLGPGRRRRRRRAGPEQGVQRPVGRAGGPGPHRRGAEGGRAEGVRGVKVGSKSGTARLFSTQAKAKAYADEVAKAGDEKTATVGTVVVEAPTKDDVNYIVYAYEGG